MDALALAEQKRLRVKATLDALVAGKDWAETPMAQVQDAEIKRQVYDFASRLCRVKGDVPGYKRLAAQA